MQRSAFVTNSMGLSMLEGREGGEGGRIEVRVVIMMGGRRLGVVRRLSLGCINTKIMLKYIYIISKSS